MITPMPQGSRATRFPVSETSAHVARWLPIGLAPGFLPGLVRRVLTLPPDAEPSPNADPAANADRADADPTSPRSGGRVGQVLARRWQMLALAAVLLLAAFLNLYRLNQEGNANQYYTATVY